MTGSNDGRKGYAQLSNGFWRNVKIAELRETCKSAVGVYTMMLSYCSDRMTDGHVERKAARYLLRATGEELAALIEAGLITETGDGYQIHDYLAHNNSRDQIMHKRQREKRRYEARKENSAGSLPAEPRQKSDRIGTNIKHKTQNKKEEEELHSSSSKEPAESQTADEWIHTAHGADTISRLRDTYPRLDMRDATAAFARHHWDARKPPGAWARLFQGWCERRADMSGIQPARRHLHTWKCEHVLQALGRTEETAQPDSTACELAKQLNQKEKQ
ncbi:hypothetical protein [uncultured Bifidobacterium sp.]|uniref:hypothetical protein n=1 Tax=uncultured Bifidobacterium sp. TaxID=165187 RepID=UPI002590B659|nr:hypothetical protein [uncultured Bifidobacterium sp.]